jgi:lipocalin
VAFICIAAYGVASRAMIKQDEVTFTLRSIFANIFYAPYWLLYADAEDEKKTLDG